MKSVPAQGARDNYNDIRAFLNICELIAVGVRRGAFSKSVSYDYWGDVIPKSYRDAKQLIDNIRSDPEEGSKHTYIELEKLAGRWDNGTAGGTMKRGFFRLWVILTVVWIAGGAWLFWDDLTGKLRPEEVAANVAANVPEGYILTPILENVHERCRYALELLLLPPLGLLALGCAGFWVVRGFQS